MSGLVTQPSLLIDEDHDIKQAINEIFDRGTQGYIAKVV